jgi:hypothetical protein
MTFSLPLVSLAFFRGAHSKNGVYCMPISSVHNVARMSARPDPLRSVTGESMHDLQNGFRPRVAVRLPTA